MFLCRSVKLACFFLRLKMTKNAIVTAERSVILTDFVIQKPNLSRML